MPSMPSLESTIALIENFGTLSFLVIGYMLITSVFLKSSSLPKNSTLLENTIKGIMFGTIAAFVILTPIEVSPGIFFDSRAVPLILSGIFGGPVAAIITTVMAIAARISMGGVGVQPAIVGACAACLISIALWWFKHHSRSFNTFYIALGGVLNGVSISIIIVLMIGVEAMASLAGVVLTATIISTFGCYAFGWLLTLEESRQNLVVNLEKAKLKSEKANLAKSEFLSHMSHELRTPMTALVGAMEVLEKENLSQSGYSILRVTQRSAAHMMILLNDLLDLSKITSQNLKLNKQPFDLQSLTYDLETLYSKTTIQKGLLFKVDHADSIPDIVIVDSMRLIQIINNLVNNAVKFTEKGEIIVSIDMSPHNKDQNILVISVTDNGIGIPQHRIKDIFNDFEQADSGISKTYGGTGLGLPISRKLAQLMGGDLTVLSTYGSGSTFTLSIPVTVIEKKHSKQKQPDDMPLFLTQEVVQSKEDLPLDNVRVLLADDVEANRLIIGRLLEAQGADVTTVVNGAQCCEVVHQSFDLILMDMHMPVMNGIDATIQIRKMDNSIRQPIILALTADIMPGSKRSLHNAGVDGVLTKPINIKELISVFSILHQQKTAMSPLHITELSKTLISTQEHYVTDNNVFSIEKALQKIEATDVWSKTIYNGFIANLGIKSTQEIFREFPTCIRKSFSLLQEQHDKPDNLANFSSYAHTFKGIAANFGFERLAVIAEKMEQCSTSNDLATLIDLASTEINVACSKIDLFISTEAVRTKISQAVSS